MEQQRLGGGVDAQGADLAEEDGVVAGRVAGDDLTVEETGHVRQIGEPVTAVKWATSTKALCPRGRSPEAKNRDTGSWSAVSTLTANTPPAAMAVHPCAPDMTHTSTNGGSSDREVKALAVMP